MVETNGMRQFMILLYKGLLLRKRHYIITLFEVVIPVFIVSIPAIIQSEYLSTSPIHEMGEKSSLWLNASFYEPADPYKFKMATENNLEFVYSPSNVTDEFMSDAIKRFKQHTQYTGNITQKSAKDERDLESYCLFRQKESPNLIILGTVFNSFGKPLPESLDYKIRYGGGYSGNNLFTQVKYRVNGPQTTNVYTDSCFLGWQTAVEETFIQKKMIEKGKEIDYKVWIQRFPYPEHRDSSKTFTVINIIPWVIGYGYLIFIMNIVRRVIEEKTNGSKELLKMMGMTDFVYWSSTFMNYFIIAVITMLINTIIYKSPLKNSFVFVKNMDFMLLFFMLTLFMASLILLCLALSIFFNKSIFAILVLIALHIISFTLLMSKYFLLDMVLNYLPLPLIQKLGICLLPSGALLSMFNIISFYEASGEGAQWHNLTEFGLLPDLNLLMIIAMMLVSCILFIIIIWYFDAVWPWQPGVAKPFYFPFTRSYWCGVKPEDLGQILVNQNDDSSDFFEEEPPGATPGVVIRHLSKEFRTGLQTKLAVNNVSLNIYQGQITALLGHNGAGKTTTINILTGLYSPSSGSAAINGLDILTDTIRARRGLGVCPQHNVLYDTLTVEEHLRIYAAMKGFPWNKLTAEATSVLNILKLTDKRNELIKNLSGGMKRKLSLGIAIVGGSKVLFLDEPTSGMDVEARRSVWDALLDIRHDRTIILTTHYMEEADVLGDRIAIMAEGEVQCCGSPMFLKHKFGTGYHLHVVKGTDFHLNDLTTLLEKFTPGVTVGNELEKEIAFNLSSDTCTGFGDMFEELEEHKNKLGVLSYGITITTMEDVFLNVSNISDMKYKLQSGSEQKNGTDVEFEDVYGDSNKNRIHRDPVNQFLGLLLKRFHYSKRHWGILFAQLIVPFILMCFALHLINGSGNQYKDTFDPLTLNIANEYGHTDGFYYTKDGQYPELAATLKNVLQANKVTVKSVPDPTQYILQYGKQDISKYLKTLLVGGAIDRLSNGTWNFTAWYNGEPYHATPMSLLLMHTAILRNVTNAGSITLTNAPLPQPILHVTGDSMRILERILAAVFIPLTLGYLSASFAIFPTHERTSKAKLLQLMSGVPAVMYWISMFVWDFMVYVVVSCLLIIPYAIFSHHIFFAPHSEAIGTALLMMLLYGWSSIPFSYIVSFIFKKGNSSFSAVVGFCSIFGIGVATSLRAIQFSFGVMPLKEVDAAIWAFRILPTFSVSIGFSNLFGIAYNNAFCEGFSEKDLKLNCDSSTMETWNPLFKCCKNLCGDECLIQTYPITLDQNGCGRDILFLAIDGAIYFLILFLLETSIMAAIGRSVKHYVQKMRRSVADQVLIEKIMEDSDVLAEEERVRNMYAARSDAGDEALLVLDLTKVFKNLNAVDHLTFGIHKEECFGLLGVNGAGKTTTFRMLTGDCYPTEGNALIQDLSVRTNLKKFQSHLGYCPQFDALLDRLTGREMLQLFARLRGLSGFELEERVNMMIKMTDLTEHADKQTQFYSGGNKRKLSVGIALIGSPPLLLLDEPTAGVDPVSRRKIWNILSQARNKTGAAVILTTHSMEESEALCSRLAIMVNGRFRCLGSIQQLKSKYGQGYTLIIKMKREDQNDYQVVGDMKKHVENSMQGAELKDDHQGMLQYHVIDPTVTLSRLFKFMSDMKTEFNLEDYLISDTSLEQIFLTFARAQRILT